MNLPTVPEQSRDLIQTLFNTVGAKTVRAYRADLERFADHCGGSLEGFIQNGALEANRLTAEFRQALIDSGLASATINRKLSAIRSLVKLANAIGLIQWSVVIPNLPQESYRDTRGPEPKIVSAMFVKVASKACRKSIRNNCILHLLFDMALREFEVTGLDLEHVDLERSVVMVLGKRRTERVPVTLPAPAREALAEWVKVRGDHQGPLFMRLDREGATTRITEKAVYDLVMKLGSGVGAKVTPHGLRHAAITSALELTGGNVRNVQKFSRHKDLNTLIKYDDNRQDLAGTVAGIVAESLHG